MLWNVQASIKPKPNQSRQQAIIGSILKNRGLKTQKDIHDFTHPQDPLTLTPKQVGLSAKSLQAVITRITQTIKANQPILIYGDYDADGITATAILWETLHRLGARAYPFIPDREKHGYGLSVKGLAAAMEQYHSQIANQTPLIITVDNGITANQVAEYLKEQNIPLIITDHHQKGDTDPDAIAVLHTDTISGAGVAWMLAKELEIQNPGAKVISTPGLSSLDLVAIGTVADLMPLVGVNRAIVKHGLAALTQTKRVGLQALYQEANIDGLSLEAYHIGYIIAPRLNAMGRLAHALDSLRLLLTNNPSRANTLALQLGAINRDRQDITQIHVDQALEIVGASTDQHILIVDHADFHEGVIGLVAGKLAEKYSRPAIVISRKAEVSKASARSVSGVNLIELIRTHESHLVSVGGHPMAAGFSINTDQIDAFRQSLQTHAMQNISADQLNPTLKLDVELKPEDLTMELFQELDALRPFGIGNPKPLFALKDLTVNEARTVGRDSQHLKLTVAGISAIGFNLGHHLPDIIKSGTVSLAASLDLNTFNGRTTLQLNLKDIKA